jgi:hypothetical protein
LFGFQYVPPRRCDARIRKYPSPPQEEKAPFVRGRRGNPTDRHFSDEEIESMTAKQYRENVLGIKRGNGE